MPSVMDVMPLTPDDAAAEDLARACADQVLPAMVQRLVVRGCATGDLRTRALQLLFEHLTGRSAAARGLRFSGFVGPLRDTMPSLAPSEIAELCAPLEGFDRDVRHVRALGTVFERLLEVQPIVREPWVQADRSRRKRSGSYYTPAFMIDHVVSATLGPILEHRTAALNLDAISSPEAAARAIDSLVNLRVLDPAMGTGHFLIAAMDFIARRVADALAGVCARVGSPELVTPIRLRSLILRRCLFGVEVDPLAAAIARSLLHVHAGADTDPSPSLASNLRAGDALRSLGVERSQWGTFDAVIGNPPFVDAECMTRHDPQLRAIARAHFASARGNWDLYVLFVELALRLTRPGGFAGMVTPSRLLAADYAAVIQQLILERTLISCVDYSSVSAFGKTQVPVVVCVVENTAPPPGHAVHFVRLNAQRRVHARVQVCVEMLRDLPSGFIGLPLRMSDPNLLSVAMSDHRLADVAQCSDGATTAEAYRIAEVIADAADDVPDPNVYVRLVNTGLIDPFRLHWGNKPCRYLGLTLRRPVVRRADLSAIAPRRLEQTDQWTVLIAGMGSRLEAVVAPPGYLCGKSAVLVVPREGICPFALAAVLNSSFMSELYCALFGLRALSTTSLAIGPRQVARLPFPSADLLGPAPREGSGLQAASLDVGTDRLLTLARRNGLLSAVGSRLSARSNRSSELDARWAERIVRAAMLRRDADLGTASQRWASRQAIR